MNPRPNYEAFRAQLQKEYEVLFDTPEYAYSKRITTPAALAEKMTASLAKGSGNKEGKGIQNTCRHFKIPYTYAGIGAFLRS